jgi:hypothetical protein
VPWLPPRIAVEERLELLPAWLDYCNYHRTHAELKNQSPMTVLVSNVPGQYRAGRLATLVAGMNRPASASLASYGPLQGELVEPVTCDQPALAVDADD